MKDWGNFLVLSFKSECSYIHKGEGIIHLENKHIKSQLLDYFFLIIYSHMYLSTEKIRGDQKTITLFFSNFWDFGFILYEVGNNVC